ncbi:hypothetical protein FSW04_18185 [Baekduia soli]|uniref:Uncharacterized protein n=1 Tax=Baekduia soli TaxID=496014 RepID=A0A5B8U878_9ACTN|nr:hypothetical protein [Baekduia soli]QEC49316.1 hypothetical protein FSW04_18185 [Baekduia soli]
MDDEAIRTLVRRLSRPHPEGGKVIERAAVLAAGTDANEVLAWITANAGEPEAQGAVSAGRGLHSARVDQSRTAANRAPLRYVFPPGTL